MISCNGTTLRLSLFLVAFTVMSPSMHAAANSKTPFLFRVEGSWAMRGHGTLVFGHVDRGRVKLNDPVEIVGLLPTRQTVVLAIQMVGKRLDEAVAGDSVGLLLRGITPRDIQRGQVIAKPGSIAPYTHFTATISMFRGVRGARTTGVTTGYRPQFYFRTTDVTGTMVIKSRRIVMPGDRNVAVEIELRRPVAIEAGLQFAIREGSRSVGAGIVTGIIKSSARGLKLVRPAVAARRLQVFNSVLRTSSAGTVAPLRLRHAGPAAQLSVRSVARLRTPRLKARPHAFTQQEPQADYPPASQDAGSRRHAGWRAPNRLHHLKVVCSTAPRPLG